MYFEVPATLVIFLHSCTELNISREGFVAGLVEFFSLICTFVVYFTIHRPMLGKSIYCESDKSLFRKKQFAV